ncbi:MAG TPA: ABC transporter permease [Dehalococcoidia bacterium]|nr:ABC transporter permease [Dehalococcoidia bacterium]
MAEDVVQTEAVRPHHTLWGDAFIRLRRNRLAVVGGVLVLLVALAAIFVPIFSPYGFAQQNLDAIREGPSWSHLFGTDELGRDVFTRLFAGARTSLMVGIFVQVIVIVIGLPIGAIAAYAGGRTDNLIMRFVDVMYAFPDILLIILIRAILGGSIYMIFLAIGLVAWVNVARLVRGQILSLKERDFATAARAMGAPGRYIVWRHLLPNSLGPIIVLITFGIPRAIFAEAALSYIGIGIKPPTPSWGTMIRDGYDLIFSAPHLVLFPAIALGILMLAFTFLGDGLRDALDPRLRR